MYDTGGGGLLVAGPADLDCSILLILSHALLDDIVTPLVMAGAVRSVYSRTSPFTLVYELN